MLAGCAGSGYDDINVRAGVEFPIPGFPLFIGCDIHLGGALKEKRHEEDAVAAFDRYLDDLLLDDQQGEGRGSEGSRGREDAGEQGGRE